MTVEEKEKTQTTTVEENKADLLKGTEAEKAEENKAAETEKKPEEKEQSETAAEVIKPEHISAIQDLAVDGAAPLVQYREDADFLLKQLDIYDPAQFQKGGLYEGLPVLTFNGKSIYQMSETEIENGIKAIEDSDMSTQDKRRNIREFDKAIILFQKRKEHLLEKINEGLIKTEYDEWQKVESSFTNKETGFPELKKHIPEIWEFCKSKMEASPSLKAKCEGRNGSVTEKVKLVARAIKELGISQKLTGDDSENERANVGIPAGNAGKQSPSRGSKEPTFTRAQIRDLQSKGKITPAVLAQINKAMAEGRIKDE